MNFPYPLFSKQLYQHAIKCVPTEVALLFICSYVLCMHLTVVCEYTHGLRFLGLSPCTLSMFNVETNLVYYFEGDVNSKNLFSQDEGKTIYIHPEGVDLSPAVWPPRNARKCEMRQNSRDETDEEVK